MDQEARLKAIYGAACGGGKTVMQRVIRRKLVRELKKNPNGSGTKKA